MHNDLNFLTVALENNHEERQITIRCESMDQRDDMLMGIRNMVAVSSLMLSDDDLYDMNNDVHTAIAAADSYADADMNEEDMGNLYPDADNDPEMEEFAGPGSMYSGNIAMTNPMQAKLNEANRQKSKANSDAAPAKLVGNLTNPKRHPSISNQQMGFSGGGGGVAFEDNPLARKR